MILYRLMWRSTSESGGCTVIDWEDYVSRVREMLGDKRYHHSMCVRQRAEELAALHGGDVERAGLAGFLHDIFHDKPKDAQLKYMEHRGIMLESFVRDHPLLWHAVCGADYLEQEQNISDRAVLDAVRYHTTGRAGMSLLEKIVFQADATSADREYSGIEEKRLLADASLDRAMLDSLSYELLARVKKGQTIVRDAWEAYNYFTGICNTIHENSPKEAEQ